MGHYDEVKKDIEMEDDFSVAMRGYPQRGNEPLRLDIYPYKYEGHC